MMSMKIEVDLSKAPNAAKMTKQHDNVVGAALVEIGNIFVNTIQQNTPLGATKLLRGSIYSEPRGVPIREVLVGTPYFYGAIVDRGRRPGKVPITVEMVPGKRKKGQVKRLRALPLEPWVRRVLGLSGDAVIKVAVAVAMKIGKRGTAGAAQVYKGFVQGRPAAERVVNKIGGTIVAEWER
jgi:hypothetical protein